LKIALTRRQWSSDTPRIFAPNPRVRSAEITPFSAFQTQAAVAGSFRDPRPASSTPGVNLVEAV
jgi:hypothetical protein